MIQPKKKLRQVLFSIHPLSYRIKKVLPDLNTMNRQLFIKVIDELKKIEDRRDFLQAEIGMDMTVYEDSFFAVIENLMKLAFNKEQLGLIKLHLYDLSPDKDWDGTIMIEERKVNFKTSLDLWKAVKIFD